MTTVQVAVISGYSCLMFGLTVGGIIGKYYGRKHAMELFAPDFLLEKTRRSAGTEHRISLIRKNRKRRLDAQRAQLSRISRAAAR